MVVLSGDRYNFLTPCAERNNILVYVDIIL